MIAAVPAALAVVGSPEGVVGFVLLALRWVLMAVLIILRTALVYRYGPSRATARIRWVSPGAIAATVLWIVASVAFSLYVQHFGSYDKTFGSLGAVVILLMWFYISAYVVCLGAELNAELERQTRQFHDRSGEADRRPPVPTPPTTKPRDSYRGGSMNNIFWLIGVIVVVLAILSLLGLR